MDVETRYLILEMLTEASQGFQTAESALRGLQAYRSAARLPIDPDSAERLTAALRTEVDRAWTAWAREMKGDGLSVPD